MEREIIAPKLYFYLEGKTNLKNLMQFAAPTVDLAYAEAARLELEKTGPIEFLYFGASPDMEKEFTLQIGFPTTATKPSEHGFQFRQRNEFKCLKVHYQGPIKEIGREYEKIYEHLWNNSIKHTNEIREIYHHFEHPDSPNNLTEIQIGLV